jgi:hypothetical protein
MLSPEFDFELQQHIEKDVVVIAKYDGRHPTLTAATNVGKARQRIRKCRNFPSGSSGGKFPSGRIICVGLARMLGMWMVKGAWGGGGCWECG